MRRWGMAGLAATIALSCGAATAIAADSRQCAKRTGIGWAPTEHLARLKAWEIVAQATGNWPIQSDRFQRTRYTCRPDHRGIHCVVAIDVCRG